MSNQAQRYSKTQLPYYKYLPGLGKHPSTRNEAHIPKINDSIESLSEENWQNNEHFRYAIDLFNNGYYWEMHEVLEVLWLSLGKKSKVSQFLQGLIQLGIAYLKKELKNENGVIRLKTKSLNKISQYKPSYLGINVDLLITQSNKFLSTSTFFSTSTLPKIKLKQ